MTLRQAVLAVGLPLAGMGAAALLTGAVRSGLVAALWGILLVAGIACERFRHKSLEDHVPGPDWTGTAERFIDPETGGRVRVYVNGAGERRYVQE
jgi:hypothetical protein